MLMLTSSIIFCWKEYLCTASYWIILKTATSNSVVEDTVVQSLVQKYFAQFFVKTISYTIIEIPEALSSLEGFT